jgi:hypothetical protein
MDVTGGSIGGFFRNGVGDGAVYISDASFGLSSYGSGAGGAFYDWNNSGQALLGYGDLGILGQGLQAGGHFVKPATNAHVYLAASNGAFENAVYGISNGSFETPGYFLDQQTGNYVYLAFGSFKLYGVGSVNFIQNDPVDKSRVIIYTAPEGDDVAVYTRGTARLRGGVAAVPLTATFASVANPDIGLTVQVTPRGTAVPLAVESVTTSQLVVRGPAGGSQDVAFDYAVWGLRIGFENRPVVRPKSKRPSYRRWKRTTSFLPRSRSWRRSRRSSGSSGWNPTLIRSAPPHEATPRPMP